MSKESLETSTETSLIDGIQSVLLLDPFAHWMGLKSSTLVSALILILLMAQATTAAAMLLEAVPGEQVVLADKDGEEKREEVVVIIGDNYLRAWCIVGSVFGSILSVALFPPSEKSQTVAVRRISVNCLISMISGVMFSPVLVRFYDLPRDGDWVLFTSGVVSLSSVSVLQLTVPLIPLMAKGKFKALFKSALLDAEPTSQEPKEPTNGP